MRVVIADDSALLREGLRLVLDALGVDVAATVDTTDRLFESVEAHRPDVAIVDIRLPPTFTDEGSRAAAALLERDPPVPVLLLSQSLETRVAGQIAATHPRGFGYLLKDKVADGESLARALDAIHAGATVLDPDVVAALVGRTGTRRQLDRLTPREREVLGHIAAGMSNTAIAEALVVSPKTVESHVAAIFTALDLPPETASHRRVTAVLRWLDAGGSPGGTG